MSSALAVPGRPCAPHNGLYFRMEDDNYKKRFKNHLRMEILDDIACVVYPKSRSKKTYTLTLTPADDACMIDWTPLNNTWPAGRLQFVCAEGVPGLLEDAAKFWKLAEEYSRDYVARRKIELEAQSPLALTDAGTAAGASNVRPGAPPEWLGADPGARVHAGPSGEILPADHTNPDEGDPLAAVDAVIAISESAREAETADCASDVRPRAPREWLGSDPGARVHAGPSEEVLLADASSQRNVRPRFAQEDAPQHPSAHFGTPDESGDQYV